jgi:hypothetical protein
METTQIQNASSTGTTPTSTTSPTYENLESGNFFLINLHILFCNLLIKLFAII